MTNFLVFPLLVTLAVAAIVTSVHRRLPPRLATRFVTLSLVLVVLAAIPTAFVVAVAFLAHSRLFGAGFQACAHAVGIHDSVPAWLGVPVIVLIVLGAVRTTRLIQQHRTYRVHDVHPIHIAHSHTPYAVTLPGRAGQIVISTALVDMLDEDEQRVIVAHECAHATHRHDRYLLTAELAAAALPPLRALARRVSYSIERWADEVAARACGDRRLVALTLGKVALQAAPSTVAGFAGLGVASRMGALLAPEIPHPRRGHVAALWASLAVMGAFSLFQLHHLEQLISAFCIH